MRSRAHSSYTASTRIVRPAIDTLRRLGRGPAGLLARFELDEQQLRDDDRRIPQDVVVELWDLARTESGSDAFGLLALETMTARQRTLVDYVLLNSPTLGALIERGMRYERLWQEGREASLEIERDRAVVRWRARPGLRFSAPLVEFGLLAISRLTRAALGRREGGPLEVRMAHPAPADVRPYEAAFRAPVTFAAPEYAVCFPARDLALEIPAADPALLAVLEQHAALALEKLPPTRSFGQSVRHTLARELPGGEPTLQRIAERLHCSPRTVRRRLSEEGASFQHLLEELRRELALRYLGDATLSVTEIAFLLGFADAAAFSKAFRRWTGSSPIEFRRR